ncbi:type II secretion system minor pseudopilin GspK [Thiohalobacter sp. IOR34]|uniref:type II secretion system minor pseudopilin GspK n=1 Tax=Thiohalobacter sp. IOR34 TaxID=3057176 RepID=UPI0025B2556B|nr:type II secretion system minor pseudopilin GspK [Thiohalobacter sp. IOR34]WJW75224.1 type II secretion system minor pseudopilin GspK [Thiohalobacter sp. IOR34]
MAVPAAGLNRQRGVALLTAVLVVALATVAAVGMASRQQLDIRRSANLLQADQALAYALGVEDWARVVLRRDREENRVDHLGEDWARRLMPLAVEGGMLTGFVEDQQGRFNLNNLLVDGRPSEPDLAQFRRLLEQLDLDPGLALALLDWMDADLEPRFPGGAEDDLYLLRTPPYRAANRHLVSPSELRLVAGFDAAVVSRLAPYVTALPARTPINVNTAPALVLQSLHPALTPADAEQLVEGRGDEGYASVDAFLRQEVFAGRTLDAGRLAVSSQYFLLRAEVQLGTARRRLESLLQRDAKGLRCLLRSRGDW